MSRMQSLYSWHFSAAGVDRTKENIGKTERTKIKAIVFEE